MVFRSVCSHGWGVDVEGVMGVAEVMISFMAARLTDSLNLISCPAPLSRAFGPGCADGEGDTDVL
jgi:hypothetical protein